MNYGNYAMTNMPYAAQPVPGSNPRGFVSPGYRVGGSRVASRFSAQPVDQPQLAYPNYQPQQWKPNLLGAPQPAPRSNRLMGIGAIQPMRLQW